MLFALVSGFCCLPSYGGIIAVCRSEHASHHRVASRCGRQLSPRCFFPLIMHPAASSPSEKKNNAEDHCTCHKHIMQNEAKEKRTPRRGERCARQPHCIQTTSYTLSVQLQSTYIGHRYTPPPPQLHPRAPPTPAPPSSGLHSPAPLPRLSFPRRLVA